MNHPAVTPSRRASPYSFPVLQRVGGWVGLGGWLHTEVICPPSKTVIYTSTNRPIVWRLGIEVTTIDSVPTPYTHYTAEPCSGHHNGLEISLLGRVVCTRCLDAAFCSRCCTQHGLCVLDTRVSCAKNGWTDRDAVWGPTLVGPKEPCVRWGSRFSHGNGQFEGDVPAHSKVPTHECIPHCSPTAAGECACTAHAVDECIRRRAWQDVDAAFCQITL